MVCVEVEIDDGVLALKAPPLLFPEEAPVPTEAILVEVNVADKAHPWKI